MYKISKPTTYDEWRTFLGLPEVSQEVKTAAMWRHLDQQAETLVARVTDWTNKLEKNLQPFIDAMTDMANTPTGRWTE